MPSKSKKQARLMAAVAHNPAFAKKVGIPQSVGKDFNKADAGTGILKKAEGGGVSKKRLKRLREIADSVQRSLTAPLRAVGVDIDPSLLARVVQSGAKNVGTLTPGGELELGMHPGIIDNAMALPELLPVLGAAAEYADAAWPSTTPLRNVNMGFNKLANYDTPGWSKRASDRLAAADKLAMEGMGLSEPRGLAQHMAHGAGEMLTQVPLVGLGDKPKGVLKSALKAIPEYLGPTVRPSVGNYLQGTLGGGFLGILGDPDEDKQMSNYCDGGISRLKTKYASGGKVSAIIKESGHASGGPVGKSAEAVKAIQAAISHLMNRDSASAMKVLQLNKEVATDPNVKAAMQDLSMSKPLSASRRLNMMVEQDKNLTAVPMLADGGDVSFDDYVNSLL